MEYRLMRDLRDRGFRRALRGDEAFGWSIEVNDITGAMNRVMLRRFGDDPRLEGFIRPELYERWCAASDASFERVTQEVAGLEPNDAKDSLYFAHRLEGYLNTASYFKMPWLDQRNALLDDDILEFLEHVPWRLRIEKGLYHRAMRLAFPRLWEMPFADASNLEDWPTLITEAGPVRQFIRTSIEDGESQMWQWVDREALHNLANAAPTPPRHGHRSSMLRSAFFALPRPIMARARGWRAAHDRLRLSPDKILLRFLVLKEFVDQVAMPGVNGNQGPRVELPDGAA
jgi:hypothetical protein